MSRGQRYPEKLLSVAEIALLTGLHKETVLDEINNGELKKAAVMLRGKFRVPVSAYNAWIDQGRLVMREGDS